MRPALTTVASRSPHRDRRGGSLATPRAGEVLISVITVVYNGRQELPRTLDSLEAQGYEPLEHVVIDGGSVDGTVELISTDARISHWLSEPDNGIYDAMNKGIAVASGQLIAFLNAGDRYHPGALAAAAAAFRQNGETCIYFGAQINDYVDLGLEVCLAAAPHQLPHKMSVCHESIFVPRRVFAAGGLHDTRYSLAADYAFLASEHATGRCFVDLGQPVAVFESGGASFRGFARYRREMLVHSWRSGSRGWPLVAARGAWEVALLKLYRLFLPILGPRRADSLRRWWLSRRGAVVKAMTTGAVTGAVRKER